MEPKKILIADDEPEILRALSMRLKGVGYKVITAADGLQATQKAIKEFPDLIILDISMPAGSGHEVVKRLKNATETDGIPIIFLTASTDLEDMKKSFDANVAQYITKPFKPEELLTTIDFILNFGKKKISSSV